MPTLYKLSLKQHSIAKPDESPAWKHSGSHDLEQQLLHCRCTRNTSYLLEFIQSSHQRFIRIPGDVKTIPSLIEEGTPMCEEHQQWAKLCYEKMKRGQMCMDINEGCRSV